MPESFELLIPAIGQALLHFVWQGALIGLLAAVALRGARHAKPQVRYAIGCVALLACAVAPLLTAAFQFVDVAPAASIAVASTNDGVVLTVVGADATPDWQSRLAAWQPLIVAMWAAGASVFCLRTLFGVAWVRRMRMAPQPPLQARWQASLDRLAEQVGVRAVALRIVEALDSPVAAGCLRPVVLLPLSVALRMPTHLVEALLAHELAHIRRHDYLVNLLQRAVEALLFYHPVTWWLSHRIRVERELVADALAADAIGDARRLAVALATLSDLARQHPALPHVAPAAHGGQLMSRIQQLVRPGAPSHKRMPTGRVALPLIGVAAACIAFYAQAQIGKDAPGKNAAAPAAAPATAPTAVTPVTPDTPVTPEPAPTPETPPVPVTPPTPPSNGVQVAQHSVHRYGDDRDAWAIVRKGKDGYSMSGSTDDMDDIDAAKRSLTRDFIWFRRDGKAYVIDDPSIVGRAQAAWKDSDVLGEKMSRLGDKMDVHGKKMEKLGKQMESLSAGHVPSSQMMAAQERMTSLAGQQQELAGRQQLLAMKQRKADSDAEEQKLDAEMNALSEEMNKLGDEMDAQGKILDRESKKLEADSAPMEALGKQMEEAAQPMNALGSEMGKLGEQQERLAKKATRELDALISEGVQKGLAKPAPGVRTAQ
jgi:beta-lactamase regulating signal transducer with metallopeptidase domain/archaellum component FlaC